MLRKALVPVSDDVWVAVVTSHMFIVWSHDALHTSFSLNHSTEETASLWPSRVMSGVLVVGFGVSVLAFFRSCSLPSEELSSISADQILMVLSKDALHILLPASSTASESTLLECPLQQYRHF